MGGACWAVGSCRTEDEPCWISTIAVGARWARLAVALTCQVLVGAGWASLADQGAGGTPVTSLAKSRGGSASGRRAVSRGREGAGAAGAVGSGRAAASLAGVGAVRVGESFNQAGVSGRTRLASGDLRGAFTGGVRANRARARRRSSHAAVAACRANQVVRFGCSGRTVVASLAPSSRTAVCVVLAVAAWIAGRG